MTSKGIAQSQEESDETASSFLKMFPDAKTYDLTKPLKRTYPFQPQYWPDGQPKQSWGLEKSLHQHGVDTDVLAVLTEPSDGRKVQRVAIQVFIDGESYEADLNGAFAEHKALIYDQVLKKGAALDFINDYKGGGCLLNGKSYNETLAYLKEKRQK